MKLLNLFRRKKVYVVPYVLSEDAAEVYVLFFIAKTIKEVTYKIQQVAQKYDLSFFILVDEIESIKSSNVIDEDNTSVIVNYNKSSDIDFMYHFSRAFDPDAVEPYFMYTYLGDFVNNCGFKTTNLGALYKEYEKFFAANGLFVEAADCKKRSQELNKTT